MHKRQSFSRTKCQENLIDYFPIITDQSLEFCLTEYLKKEKKIRIELYLLQQYLLNRTSLNFFYIYLYFQYQ